MGQEYHPHWVRRAFKALGIKHKPELGFTYFIQAEHVNLIKIGWTRNYPMVRLWNLQTACPVVLHILAIMVGTVEQEEALQRRFASLLVRGEWYRPEEDLLEYIGWHGVPWQEMTDLAEAARKAEFAFPNFPMRDRAMVVDDSVPVSKEPKGTIAGLAAPKRFFSSFKVLAEMQRERQQRDNS